MPVRKIPLGSRGVRGGFPSHKVGRTVAYESRLERDLFLLLETDPDVRSYEEQPVRIEFTVGARTHHYTPDCRIDYADRRVDLVEVKYEEDVAGMNAERRTAFDRSNAAATHYCASRGWRFRVMTDRDIVTPRLERARHLRRFSRAPACAETGRVEIETLLLQRGAMNMGELLRVLLVPEAHAVIAHLLWIGVLQSDVDKPLTDATQLRL